MPGVFDPRVFSAETHKADDRAEERGARRGEERDLAEESEAGN
jgi:hypothetical protein